MKKIVLLAVLCGLVLLPAYAQQYFQNTLFPHSQFAYNPAAAGARKLGMQTGSYLTLLGRLQWVGGGFDGGPRTSFITYDGDLPGEAGYIGAMALVDQQGEGGVWTTTTLNVAYAYALDLGGPRLRIGASGGLKQFRLDGTEFQAVDDGDAVIPDGIVNVGVADLNAGVYLTNDYRGSNDLRYFAGFSVQNLLEPSIEGLLPSAIGDDSRDTRTFIFSGGYNFRLSPRSFIMPSVLIMTDGVGLPQASVSAYWSYNPIFAGLNFRMNATESIGALFGVHINDRLSLAYAYDYPTTFFSTQGGGGLNTHELVLTYLISLPRTGSNTQGEDILKDADQGGF